MASSLCITNEKLSLVCGSASARRIRVRDFAAATLPAGALINGVITDERLFKQALDELREKLPKKALRDVKIALRTSQIYVKRMPVPKMPSRKLLEWIAGEFAGVAGGEELLYDYALLERGREKGGQAALLCAVQRTLIENLARFFAAEGVSIACIDTALSAQIKLMRLFKRTREGTYILLMMDGDGMDASLYVNGAFRFSNSVRLLAERCTPESAAEISRQVSSIIQFNSSERSGQHVSNVYIAGLRPGEEGLIDTLQASYDLEAGVLEDAEGCIVPPPERRLPLPDFAAALGNLMDM
ncbi:MAG: hypothetical protein Q4C13_01185 [Clostridia bacterium]|nr:hypothetical protein [Clostridia bacterium]